MNMLIILLFLSQQRLIKEKIKINFKIDNFPRSKDKIKFIISDYNGEIPKDKHIGGESLIEKYQRNSLQDGLKDVSPEDLIILSDSDEIPDLTKIKLIQKEKDLLLSRKECIHINLIFKLQ